MRNIRNELLLHLRQLAQFADLALHAVGHRIERLAQCGNHVFSGDLKARFQVTGCQLRRNLGRPSNGANDAPGDVKRDGTEEQNQHQATEDQSALHEVEGLLRATEVVNQIELVRASDRDFDL